MGRSQGLGRQEAWPCSERRTERAFPSQAGVGPDQAFAPTPTPLHAAWPEDARAFLGTLQLSPAAPAALQPSGLLDPGRPGSGGANGGRGLPRPA